jgi:AcrR family transcriptional regulator
VITPLRRHQPGGPEQPIRRRGSLDEVLINAAMDLFASYGYRGTSLSRIARAAGVTKGALYWHFDDKEDFFLAVVDRVIGEWSDAWESIPPAESRADFEREFLRRFEILAELNERNPWVSRLLLIIALESHKIGPRVLRAIRRGNLGQLAQFQDVVERGKLLGALQPELDVVWAGTQIIASYLGLASLWYLHGTRIDLRRALRRQAHELLAQWQSRA